MAKKQKTLQPQYVQKFKCIGAACEDSCCCGWQVTIDKTTYEQYRKCPNVKLRQKLDKKITRNRVNPNNYSYAKVKMNIDGSCPFLDEEKLCSIQRDMGEKYLSMTCGFYPRSYNIVNGVWEKSIMLSCPEAARLALSNTGLMEFDMFEEDAYIRKPPHVILLDTDDAKKRHKPEQYFVEVRTFTISLLQNRRYPLWQRLVILGLFCNNLNNLITENKPGDILNLINNFLGYLEQGVFHDSLESIPNRLGMQLEISKQLSAGRFSETENDNFTNLFIESIKGINYSEELPMEERNAQYASAYENYYLPVAAKHEYILENYLVNYVL